MHCTGYWCRFLARCHIVKMDLVGVLLVVPAALFG